MSIRHFVVPTSKSESNRVIAFLYLCKNELIKVENPSLSRDTLLLINNLKSSHSVLDFLDAGTPARIALALFAFEGRKIVLTGNQSLQKRPIQALVNVLNTFGSDIVYLENEGYFPVKIQGKIDPSLIPENVVLDRTESSQFATALMLICSQMVNIPKIQISLIGKNHSNSYIKMTAETLNRFQIPCSFHEQTNSIEIKPAKPVFPDQIFVEADWSSALYGFQYLLALAWIKNETPAWYFPQLHLPSLQGDSLTVELFESLGLCLNITQQGILCSVNSDSNTLQNSFEIDCRNFPDAVPTLVNTFAMAWFCGIKNDGHLTPHIVFQGISNLITKESNRIEALNVNLQQFGFELTKVNEEDYQLAQLTYSADAHEILTIKTYHDHRIAMSFAPWKLAIPQLQFDDVRCVEKSFPDFWNQINP